MRVTDRKVALDRCAEVVAGVSRAEDVRELAAAVWHFGRHLTPGALADLAEVLHRAAELSERVDRLRQYLNADALEEERVANAAPGAGASGKEPSP